MAHRVAPEAEVELDNIWYYVAKASGSIEAADRVIDTITERFYVLACQLLINKKELAEPDIFSKFIDPAVKRAWNQSDIQMYVWRAE
jgi:hypothetical protein